MNVHFVLPFASCNHLSKLTVAFCLTMILFHLNGNKEHFLLSSMMVYTFIGIHFPYSSIHL